MGDRVSVRTTKAALIEQGHWLTVQDCKRVLVVIHTVTFAQRLREVFELLETDLRIQLVFTVAPHAFGNGVTEFLLRRVGCARSHREVDDGCTSRPTRQWRARRARASSTAAAA